MKKKNVLLRGRSKVVRGKMDKLKKIGDSEPRSDRMMMWRREGVEGKEKGARKRSNFMR